MLVDSHCHLDAAEFAADREAVVARAQQAGVRAIIVPAVSLASLASTAAMALTWPDWAYPAYGLHPIYAHADDALIQLRAWLRQHPAVAIGEIGLDGLHSALSATEQEALFIAQLRLAQEHDLPVLLHVRRAVDSVLKCLRRHPVKGGIAHAFNGSQQQAEQFIAMGFKLGFGGALSYPRALQLRRLATQLPLESLVLETDGPDIPPEWAARSEPADIARTAALLAQLRGIAPDVVAQTTGRNVAALFNWPT